MTIPLPKVMVEDNDRSSSTSSSSSSHPAHNTIIINGGTATNAGSGGGGGLSVSPPPSPGRLKAPPVCFDLHLRSAAMTSHELSELVFPTPPTITAATETTTKETEVKTTEAAAAVAVLPSMSRSHSQCMPISSSSSTCTRESESFSDAEGGGVGHTNTTTTNTGTTTMWNAKVSSQKTSRQGRSTQRWLVEDNTNTIRLTTGCVPILKSGKILFVSSSRQSEWILPKGGWEQDEALEESAVRECFEEAGVLGTLGPKLSDVLYEPRKAKKRRLLEQQEQQEQHQQPENHQQQMLVHLSSSSKQNNESNLNKRSRLDDNGNSSGSINSCEEPGREQDSAGPTAAVADTQALLSITLSSTTSPEDSPQIGASAVASPAAAASTTRTTTPLSLSTPYATITTTNNNHINNSSSSSSNAAPSSISREGLTRIRWLAEQNAPKAHNDETLSVASSYVSNINGNSNSNNNNVAHSQVRMTLFPLYVTEVHDHWPESGRLRTAVDLDDAIRMMDHARPEFKAALQEVKDRGLHYLHDERPAA